MIADFGSPSLRVMLPVLLIGSTLGTSSLLQTSECAAIRAELSRNADRSSVNTWLLHPIHRHRTLRHNRSEHERYAALFLPISSRIMRRRASSHFGVFPSTYSRSAELINVW
jgi:hypothetical protein